MVRLYSLNLTRHEELFETFALEVHDHCQFERWRNEPAFKLTKSRLGRNEARDALARQRRRE